MQVPGPRLPAEPTSWGAQRACSLRPRHGTRGTEPPALGGRLGDAREHSRFHFRFSVCPPPLICREWPSAPSCPEQDGAHPAGTTLPAPSPAAFQRPLAVSPGVRASPHLSPICPFDHCFLSLFQRADLRGSRASWFSPRASPRCEPSLLEETVGEVHGGGERGMGAQRTGSWWPWA